ncbi:DUF6622 family protein [Roseateles sp. BYS180W]|uniref:DUF6622 family protein n=1 Tax=Roseateles rivi TaxID=3299028 RepID=A0ABW7FX48_9BURK
MQAAIPVWVPALFIGLMALGYRLSKPRRVKPAALTLLAVAMLGLSLWGEVSAFGPQPLALLLWALGYGVAAWVGAQRLTQRGLQLQGQKVHMPGSWTPLFLLLGIFACKFALGFAAGTHSPLLQDLAFIGLMSAALGALSGGFGARAVAVERCARTGQAAAEIQAG